jgi:3-carboxy-cis,cis-muconate cycloisomerase
MSAPLLERFLSTDTALGVFAPGALVQAMLDFEAALAQAEAAEGVIPAAAAASIAATCKAGDFDIDAIGTEGARAGSLAIPLVKHLTAAVKARDAAAAAWVHWGSTSQDVLDTALALCTKRALALLEPEVARLARAALDLADRHLETPALARTLLQPAQVVSFGFKVVAWAAPLVRARARLRRAASEGLQLQLGGAVGTLATLGASGPAVARRMGEALGLGVPAAAWHTQRDTWVALGCEVGILCGTLGKIGTDIGLLAQAEIGEIAEPSGEGRGGSSAMPHKRNPVAAMIARAAAVRAPHRVAALLAAMPQEQERGLGGWQAELVEWPGLWITTQGSASALAEAVAGLEVDTARMRANIDALSGLVFAEGLATALARHVGKASAHALVERLSRRVVAERRQLGELALEAIDAEPTLRGKVGRDEIAATFDVDAAARRAADAVRSQLAALRVDRAAITASSTTPSTGGSTGTTA